MVILISILAFISTSLGGLFALRHKDRLHLILGFSAGAVLGVAFFDLLPEALELGKDFYDISTLLSVVALGFVGYMILDRMIILHSHTEDDHHEHIHEKGVLGAGSLSVHSFLDGVAIGLAFQVGNAIGIIVTIAVLVHDFSDGMNTVNMIIRHGGNIKEARKWLLVDALAPIVGVLSTFFFTLEENMLGIILALFGGFFLYIGASDLLPESHHGHSTVWTTISTIAGISVLFAAIKLAGL